MPMDSGKLDEFARALVIEEHASLRSEILASYGYAQSIVKWTLATFAAVTAAGLVAINNSTGSADNPILIDVVLIVFGFGLPGIIWLNASTWLGELYRAERAGSYLRALEADISQIQGLYERMKFEPARWERFIWSNRKRKNLWGKQVVTYVGTAGTFFACAAGSFIILSIVVFQLLALNKLDPPDLAWLWLLGSALANGVFITICWLIFRCLMAIGDALAPLEARY